MHAECFFWKKSTYFSSRLACLNIARFENTLLFVKQIAILHDEFMQVGECQFSAGQASTCLALSLVTSPCMPAGARFPRYRTPASFWCDRVSPPSCQLNTNTPYYLFAAPAILNNSRMLWLWPGVCCNINFHLGQCLCFFNYLILSILLYH